MPLGTSLALIFLRADIAAQITSQSLSITATLEIDGVVTHRLVCRGSWCVWATTNT